MGCRRYVQAGTTNREDTFSMKTGVGVYGGFEGNEEKLEQRDWIANQTILSGT